MKEEDCYKPVKLGNFYSNNYLEYESNKDKIKNYINQRVPQ